MVCLAGPGKLPQSHRATGYAIAVPRLIRINTMQNNTIFRTPVVAPLFRAVFRAITFILGWKIVGDRPEEKKCLLIAVPHTSNWDFPAMMAVAFTLRLPVNWMGKHTLFPAGPLGAIMRWFGGISIDRRKSHNTVEQMAEAYQQRDELMLIITPEGTRSEVERWKGGFYHIAVAAGVPIYLGSVDVATKTAGVGPAFYPTGDYEADLREMMAFYEGKQGFRRR